MLKLKTAAAECQRCGEVVETYRESRAERRRYCSQGCAGNRKTDGVASGRKHTAIHVSADCRDLLGKSQDDMGVNALGDVIAALVRQYA